MDGVRKRTSSESSDSRKFAKNSSSSSDKVMDQVEGISEGDRRDKTLANDVNDFFFLKPNSV